MIEIFLSGKRFLRIPQLRSVVSILLCASSGLVAANPTIVLENNQPFPIDMPVCVRHVAVTQETPNAQALGSNLVLIAHVGAGARQKISLDAGRATNAAPVVIEPTTNGVALSYSGKSLGSLSWEIFLKPAGPPRKDESVSEKPENFDRGFRALPLVFEKKSAGPVFTQWIASEQTNRLRLSIELLAYAEGILDINAKLVNESADETKKVYAAVVCRWEQPTSKGRFLCYDNHINPLRGNTTSPFRRQPGRHQYTQRGVDWVRTDFDAATVAWLNDFAASFTLLDTSKKNSFKQPRYEGASMPQLSQEIQTAGKYFYSITEIARSNIKSYRDRLAENALPAQGEGVEFSSRLMFAQTTLSNPRTDQMFVGYTSFNEQRNSSNAVAVSFGVAGVKFGTSYFPYSTLGENFDAQKLPGMDREAFWPLAADTVLHWHDFADDIRRDLRIAKSMGFEFIRLHHLELLAPIPKEIRGEYLDFLFGELRHLDLHALIDIYASDDAIVALLERYGDVIDSVELENEILIWGIPVDRPLQWKRTYESIKKAAPHVRVHLIGYNNTGMFNRLEKLDVPFDRVGLHSYIDSLEAIPSARGYALALGSFCSKHGKPPVITEWNWRQLTRMTPEARAKIYPAVFENALSTRAIPEMYQFQLNETLAPNLRSGRGNILRHYELLNLSRRPKLEAYQLMKLIRKYSPNDTATYAIDVPWTVLNLDAQGKGETTLKIRNTSGRTLDAALVTESSPALHVDLSHEVANDWRNGTAISPTIKLTLSGAVPGFYYGFVRIETADGLLRYAPIEARFAGAPKLDTETKSTVLYPQGPADELKLDYQKQFLVVYGTNAAVLEVETAFAIASTLESAIGQPVEMIQLDDFAKLPKKPRNLILVGTPESNALVNSVKSQLAEGATNQVVKITTTNETEQLVVTGNDSMGVERAGMDLLLRWWKNAKDAAVRRVGLVEKELPRGGDATRLP